MITTTSSSSTKEGLGSLSPSHAPFSCSKARVFAIIVLQVSFCTVFIYLSLAGTQTERKMVNTTKYFTTNLAFYNGTPVTSSRGNGSFIITTNNNTTRLLAKEAEEIIGINSFPNLLQKYSIPKKSFQGMPRAVRGEDYTTLMRLVELTTRIFDENHIPYVLTYGSLIGSFLMHDILPWDDDVDIFINNKTKAQVLRLLERGLPHGIEGFHYHQSPGQIIKLYFNTSAKAGGYRWRWPFIDLLSYVEDKDKIRAVEKRARIIVPKKSFYPFHRRPFGPLWLFAPNDPAVFLKAKYGSFRCRSGSWNHRYEKRQAGKASVCSALAKYYPFVKRSREGNRTKETLVLNKQKLYSIQVNESPKSQNSMFEW